MTGIEPGMVRRAAEVLRSGGVIVYPTETVYGIGCDPWNRDACERVLRLKGRDASRTMLLLADSTRMVEAAAGALDERAARLAVRFWPGPLTLVLTPSREMPAHLLGASGGVAFRVTSHPDAAAVARDFGLPVISTSANPSGRPPAVSADEAGEMFGDRVDMVLPSSVPLGGVPSTVVDLTGGEPVLLREGAVPFPRILEALEP